MKSGGKIIEILIVLTVMWAADLYAWENQAGQDTRIWHSRLMPFEDKGFVPGFHDGFTLPDFSYAGYFKGEKPIPKIRTLYAIDPLPGDNTSHIQNALDKSRNGALLLNKGIYNISGEIHIPPDTVLRGKGSDKTFIIVNNNHTKRFSAIVGNRSRIGKKKVNFWRKYEGLVYKTSEDIQAGSAIVRVKISAGPAPGDYVVIKNSVTDAFREKYNGQIQVKDQKIWPTDLSSLKFLRVVKSVSETTIVLDQPIPVALKLNEIPYLLKINEMAEGIGLESLSIGFATKSLTDCFNSTKSNGANAPFHAADLVCFGNVVNGWIFDVKSFSPDNTGYHVLSRGIELLNSRHITIKDCDIGYPLNIGNGGNGYGLIISMSNDCLISNLKIRKFRHNMLFHFPSSGNVITGCQSYLSVFPNDFHHSLANTNLIENTEFDCPPKSSYQQAFVLKNRGSGSVGAGVTGMGNAFWRIEITPKTFVIQSEQAGHGYVIGATAVTGAPMTHGREWREGIGQAKGLRPISLYRTQLANRLSKKGQVN